MPVDSPDDWLAVFPDQAVEYVVQVAVIQIIQRGHDRELLQIRPTHEYLTCSGKDGHADGVVLVDRLKHIDELQQRLPIQGVALLGAIDGHPGGPLVVLILQILIAHSSSLPHVSASFSPI